MRLNRTGTGMTSRIMLLLVALTLTFLPPLSSMAATDPATPTDQAATERSWWENAWDTANQHAEWARQAGVSISEFAGKLYNCQVSGTSGCTVETVKNEIVTSITTGMANVGSKVRQMVMKLNNSCWGCDMYISIFGALMGLAGETFSYFVESREIMALTVTVLGIILVLKILLIIGAPVEQDFNRAYGDVFRYLGRIAVMFLLFLTPVTATAFKTNDGEHPAKVLFVDGPLMLGTEVGRMLVEETSGITKAKIQNRTCNPPTTGSGSLSTYATQHLATACNLLWSFHSMGVAGIASGILLIFEAPANMNNPGFGAIIAMMLAGIVMTFAFLWFTITFGLRFLDALIRSGMSLALLPMFLFLWIFEKTRSIAHAGLKSVIYMGAVFAASGFVFVICNEIMNYGFSKALGGSVNTGTDGAQAFLQAMGDGGFNWFVGSNGGGSGGEANWLSFFYLMGAWGLATKAANIVFQLAGELIEFNSGGTTGVGEDAEKSLRSTAEQGQGLAKAGIGKMTR